MSEWIPVSKELPAIGARVIVWGVLDDYGLPGFSAREAVRTTFGYYKAFCESENEKRELDTRPFLFVSGETWSAAPDTPKLFLEVTHWMPMPFEPNP